MTTVLQAPAKGEGRPGYKHTKLGWIPEEWEVKRLRQLYELRGRVGWKGYTQADLRESGPLTIGGKHINEDHQLNLGDPTYLSEEKYLESPEIMVRTGDLLFTQRGTLGRVAHVKGDIGDATINPSIVILRSRGEHSIEFVHAFLTSSVQRKQMVIETASTGVPMLSQQQIGGFRVALPPLPEQRRIAAVLGAWDRAIATVQQLLAAQQERKRGLMQELLTGRRRFKGFEGKWKECELGELGQFRTSSVDKKLVDGQQRVRLVNYMDVYNNQRIYSGMPLMEVTAKDSQLHSSSLRRGDILFTPSSETPDDIGHSAVVVEDMVNTLFSYHVMRFRPHDDTLVLDFRAYVFNNESILKQFSAKATGSTRYTLSASDFGDTLVSFPTDKSEQQAIARTLMACDSEIDSMTNQLNHLTTQKRGLMQQLLTGAVRVKV